MARAAPLDADRIFQAMGDPTRRAIINQLTLRPHSVSALAEPLGVTLTAISQHLRVLEEAGLARTAKQGRVRTATLEASGFSVLEQWIAHTRRLWEQRLDKLGDILDEEDDD